MPDGLFHGRIQGFFLVGRGRLLTAAGQGTDCLTHPAQTALPDSDTNQEPPIVENHSHVSLGACT